MKLGIGGGLGPFRAGVSTRGFGVGVGPLKMGGGWGRRRGSGGGEGLAWLIVVVFVFLLIAWPYMLGTWLAVELGAERTSTIRGVVGWVFESVYLAVLLAVFVASVQERRAEAAREAARLAAEREAMRRQRLTEAVRVGEHVESCLLVYPQGRPDPEVPAKEKLFVTFEGVSLVEPRSAYRNGPRIQKPIDTGTVWVTDHAVRYRGAAKATEWRFDKLLSATRGEDHIAFSVSNRKLVSGIGLPSELNSLFALVVDWGLAPFVGEESGPILAQITALTSDYRRALGDNSEPDALGSAVAHAARP
jgi:hypothetical protein